MFMKRYLVVNIFLFFKSDLIYMYKSIYKLYKFTTKRCGFNFVKVV